MGFLDKLSGMLSGGGGREAVGENKVVDEFLRKQKYQSVLREGELLREIRTRNLPDDVFQKLAEIGKKSIDSESFVDGVVTLGDVFVLIDSILLLGHTGDDKSFEMVRKQAFRKLIQGFGPNATVDTLFTNNHSEEYLPPFKLRSVREGGYDGNVSKLVFAVSSNTYTATGNTCVKEIHNKITATGFPLRDIYPDI